MRIRIRIRLIVVLSSITVAAAQTAAPDFGTPAGTLRLANAGAFVDVVGLKLGTPAETAVAFLKSNYPRLNINFSRTRDYAQIFDAFASDDPQKRFVYEINASPQGNEPDQFVLGLSLPPNRQNVVTIYHRLAFAEPVAVDNVVAGIRKKYGHETAGAYDYEFFNSTFVKTFAWVYDLQGRQLPKAAVPDSRGFCTADHYQGFMAFDLLLRHSATYDERSWAEHQVKGDPCKQFIVITASITMAESTPTMTGRANAITVSAADWPAVVSEGRAIYAYIDQVQQNINNKAMRDAQQRGGDIKY